MACQQRAAIELIHALPHLVAQAAATQEFAQALEHGRRPHEVTTGQREQAVEVAAHVEARPLLGRQREHEVRAHELQHGRFLQPRRGQCLRANGSNNHFTIGTPDHCAISN